MGYQGSIWEKLKDMVTNNCRPAVFLDRDGVLMEEKGYITCEKDMTVFPYSCQCVHEIKEMGYLVIVVTNQAAIGKGLLAEEILKKMNRMLIKETGVDAVYYCPHHPQAVLPEYRKECKCRKPGTGLFEQAVSDFNIDLHDSYMAGDRALDILAGKRMGVHTILLESGYGTGNLEFNVIPDYYAPDLRSVCRIISGDARKEVYNG